MLINPCRRKQIYNYNNYHYYYYRLLFTTGPSATGFHTGPGACMSRMKEEEKVSDCKLVGLFVAQCFSLSGGGRAATVSADGLKRSVPHSHPAQDYTASPASHHTVLTVKPWSVGWNPSVYPAKNRLHTLRWRGFSWQEDPPSPPLPRSSSPSSSPSPRPDWSAEQALLSLVCDAELSCMPTQLKSCLKQGGEIWHGHVTRRRQEEKDWKHWISRGRMDKTESGRGGRLGGGEWEGTTEGGGGNQYQWLILSVVATS